MSRLGGQRTEPVPYFRAEPGDLLRLRHRRETAVNVELGILGRHVLVRYVRRNVQRDIGWLQLWTVTTTHHSLDGLLQHLEVQIESHRMHETGLLGPEEVAGATQFHVLERDPVARSKLGVMLENLETALGIVVHSVGRKQIAVRTPVRPPNTSAKLIQLCQSEHVGAIHEHRVRIRNVETRLHDHCRDEHVDLALYKTAHHFFQLALAHLAVANGNTCARHQPANVLRDCVDGLDAIVHEENLSAAVQLARDSFLYQRFVPRLYVGENRRPVTWRSLHQRHVTQSRQRLVQRARNRRSGKREHVRLQSQLLEPLLVLHSKAMLLVDDDETEVAEVHIWTQQPVSADHDVHLFCRDFLESLELFLVRLEAAHHLHVDRKISKAIAERTRVLIRENRRRNEHCDLSPRLHRLERRSHRDLGLAVADVSNE